MFFLFESNLKLHNSSLSLVDTLQASFLSIRHGLDLVDQKGNFPVDYLIEEIQIERESLKLILDVGSHGL